MPPKPTIPEGPAYRAAWARLDRPARRRITRAVNRSQPLDDPSEAAIAVGFARAQQRFWRRGWLLGPAAAVILQATAGWQAIVVNAVIAAALFLLIGWFFIRRARLAETRNRAVVEAAGEPKHRARRTPKGRSGKGAKAGQPGKSRKGGRGATSTKAARRRRGNQRRS
jgi:hypothetical protein